MPEMVTYYDVDISEAIAILITGYKASAVSEFGVAGPRTVRMVSAHIISHPEYQMKLSRSYKPKNPAILFKRPL